MERLLHKKVQFRSEIPTKYTRIVHYSAQTDNGPSVNGPLYTGTGSVLCAENSHDQELVRAC